jgi:hypothetical protein
MLARPAAIAAMPVADRLTACVAHVGAAPWIVACVLLANFTAICKFAASSSESEVQQYARAVLDVILSDDGIVRELTTKRLGGLQHVFATAAAFQLSRHNSRSGIPAPMRHLYTDVNSFLYKQYRADGLALAMNIYETIFGSAILLSNFRLFDYPALDYTMRSHIADYGMDVLIESLKRSISTYLTTGDVPAMHINDGLKYISEVFGDQCSRVQRTSKGDDSFPRAPGWESIDKITHLLGHDCAYIVPREEWNARVFHHEAATQKADFRSPVSISAGFAETLTEAFLQLATIGKTVDIRWSYTTVVELLHGVMMHDAAICAEYRQAFADAIWKRIRENVVMRFFPATLRVYLDFMGFALFLMPIRGAWMQGQKERMRRLLYVDLRPLFDKNEAMVNGESMREALLPQAMRYESGRFFYRGGFGRGEESEIAEPPMGSVSALEGVKDKYDRDDH